MVDIFTSDALTADHIVLIRIGYWLGEHAPGWPDVRQFVDLEWDMDERITTAIYLRHGLLAAACLGYSHCRLCNKRVGSLEFTDGTYVWPEGLTHYVQEHSVRLPAQFLEHVRQVSGRLDEANIDDSWWNRIADEH